MGWNGSTAIDGVVGPVEQGGYPFIVHGICSQPKTQEPDGSVAVQPWLAAQLVASGIEEISMIPQPTVEPLFDGWGQESVAQGNDACRHSASVQGSSRVAGLSIFPFA